MRHCEAGPRAGQDHVRAQSQRETGADGWAVIFPTVGTSNADDSYTETIVLQAEGPIWALMDRTKVCGASEAESEVPATLYQDACQTN